MKIPTLINTINNNLNHSINKSSFKTFSITEVDTKLLNMCDNYIYDIELLQKNIYTYSKKLKTKIYPIEYHSFVAIIIGSKINDWCAFGSSHNYLNDYSKFTLLHQKLRRIGRIGVKGLKDKNGRSNRVGKCAEVKSAYNLKLKSKISNLLDIEFTNAYRPRTKQLISKCTNCVATFDKK